MSKISHILVALDISGASKKGLDIAISLAKLSDAKITCVTVLVVHPTLVAAVINYKKYMAKKAKEMLETTKKYCENKKFNLHPKFYQEIHHLKLLNLLRHKTWT